MKLISVLTRKAISDVTRRKGRTILMILGIFIGVLSLTAINGANDLFSKDLQSGIGNSFDLFFFSSERPARPCHTDGTHQQCCSDAATHSIQNNLALNR